MARQNRLRSALLLTTASALAFCASQAGAQTSAPPAPKVAQNAPTAGSSDMVAEVIVTANKRAESAINVPGAVSAVSGARLTDLGFVGQQDLAQVVPGVAVFGSNNGVGGTVVIRGVSSTAGQASPTVGTVIDGVPVGSSTGFGIFSLPIDVNLFDLDHVEVLRGPQGTLYGANTLSGLVSYITKAPSLTSTSGGMEAQLSQVQSGGTGYDLSGGGTMPIVQDRVGLRVSAFYKDIPGYLDNPIMGIKNVNSVLDYGGRASVLANVTNHLTAKVSATYQKVDGRSDDGVNYSYATKAPAYGSLTQNLPNRQAYGQEFAQIDASLEYDLGFATLASLTAYSSSNNKKNYDYSQNGEGFFNNFLAGGNAPYSTLNTRVDTEKFSQEVRLTSPNAGVFHWIVGGFYTTESTRLNQLFIGESAPATFYTPLYGSFQAHIPTKFEEYSGFANATYDVTPRLQLGGGVRVSQDHQSYQSEEGGVIAVIIGAAGTSQLAKSNESVVTYSATARYKLFDNTNVYFRTSTGYRPGGPNLVVPNTPPSFKSDSLTNYELGAKSNFWNGRASVEAALFYIDYNDVQLNTVNAQNFAYIANGGTATSKGVELSSTLKPLTGLTMTGNLTLLNAYLNQAVAPLGAVAGERLPGSPDVSGSIGAEYRHDLFDGVTGFAGGLLSYTGARTSSYINSATVPQFNLRAYTLLDLHVGAQRGATKLTFTIRNVTDERAELSTTEANIYPLVAIARPRTFMIAIQQSF